MAGRHVFRPLSQETPFIVHERAGTRYIAATPCCGAEDSSLRPPVSRLARSSSCIGAFSGWNTIKWGWGNGPRILNVCAGFCPLDGQRGRISFPRNREEGSEAGVATRFPSRRVAVGPKEIWQQRSLEERDSTLSTAGPSMNHCSLTVTLGNFLLKVVAPALRQRLDLCSAR
jgi:hypothetical protein